MSNQTTEPEPQAPTDKPAEPARLTARDVLYKKIAEMSFVVSAALPAGLYGYSAAWLYTAIPGWVQPFAYVLLLGGFFVALFAGLFAGLYAYDRIVPDYYTND